jgi:hypothetical protein
MKRPLAQYCIGTAFAWLLWVILAGLTESGTLAQPRLLSAQVRSNNWVYIDGLGQSDRILTIETSPDLARWDWLAVLCSSPGFGPHSNAFRYEDPPARFGSHRFYRVTATTAQPTNDWRNQITVVADPFLGLDQGVSGMTWVKFLILTNEPLRVYYQDSTRYQFHFEYARERFGQFRGLTAQAFDAISLHTNNQQVILGAVLMPSMARGTGAPAEYAIQFVGLDPYPPEQIKAWFELVRSTVLAPPGTVAFYFPAFEQKATALANESFFTMNGIPLSSPARWSSGNQAYADGWALGRLTFVPGARIAQAYLQGDLTPQDILLTDGLPVDMPLTAGILTLVPATPNSHVAILAGSYGLPFAYLAVTNDAAAALVLTNRDVLLQVTAGRVRLVDMSQGLDATTRTQILALKTPLPVDLQPKQRYGAYSAATDGLTPADSRFFGGKAANFGFLRRAIPNSSPPAIAFSLDLWDDFMAQQLPGGKTLRTAIAERLAPYTNYPPNLAALTAELARVRDLITKGAIFSATQQEAITNALTVFDPNRNIRFRSSSNAEDNQIFTAAGLYDSYSGCLADDLDADANGPSICDPTEVNERGVFRTMQKVYASFYNDNAFLERLRHRIDEAQVGMAVLVHHSVPDQQEMANGVATLNVHRWWNGSRYVYQITGDLVTQDGAVSVTNPRSDAQPERVRVADYGSGPYFSVEARSNLVPLGGYVLRWEDEYRQLMGLLTAVIQAYSQHFSAKADFLLDFEYKKNVPGELQVKQVRELPLARTDKVRPFLVGGSANYRLQQGEGWGSILSRQRMKCRLAVQAPTVQLTDAALAKGFYSDARFEFLEGTRIENLTGGFTNWPDAAHIATNQVSSVSLEENWTFGTGTGLRKFTLAYSVPREQPVAAPFVFERDIPKILTVSYAKPIIDPFDPTVPVSSESIFLVPYTLPSGPVRSTNSSPLYPTPPPGGQKSIEVAFYTYLYPPDGSESPDPNLIIKTYPLAFFDEVRITGLASQPIRLASYYAQSSVPAHHNWGSWHVFEPQLDPGLPQQQLDELAAANIRLLYVTIPPPWETNVLYQVLGLDGNLRPW